MPWNACGKPTWWVGRGHGAAKRKDPGDLRAALRAALSAALRASKGYQNPNTPGASGGYMGCLYMLHDYWKIFLIQRPRHTKRDDESW